ncbi:sodium/glucose cotransporter 4-like [Lytechinus variegatus]|uniref:sodium/glucose cotransporter 4-like n=1 Tax=Lytechinus variegatus TaxID=7654 RepID=UPI001BB2C2B2|nr:sodium/glucose cotransporter 4-like [Lytechinus variegatus]
MEGEEIVTPMDGQQGFVAVDIVVLVLYFVLVLAVGLGSMCRSNRGSTEGYFLAGGAMLWFPVGASLFASNIGSEHFIGLAGSGASSGIGVGAFELNAIILLQVMGWVFLPVYLAAGIYTMPEYLQKRFGGRRIRMYIAVVSLILYIFTKISVDLYSGALFIQQALGWNLYVSIFSLLAITALYTVTGGLAAVIFTDTLQAMIMLIGALWLCIESFKAIGGYQNLEPLYAQAIANETYYSNSSCGLPRDDYFHLFRHPVNSDLPWPGFIFGQTAASLWYWATDQVIVQRALSAKNLSHGQGGTLFAGLCKITPIFFIVMPGMIARILFPDIVACTDNCEEICGSKDGCSNLAYPLLVMNVLPKGIRGLMLAVMLSALMSSLTSIFNSGSTIFTMDIWRFLRRFPSDKEMTKLSRKQNKKYELELMIVGRVFVVILVAISVLWVPIVMSGEGGQLFHYIQQITAYLAPSIAGLFTVALLWERINEAGAFWGLTGAFIIGMIRMVLDFVYPSPGCGEEDLRPYGVKHLLMHYMYFALFLYLWTMLSVIIISLFTKPIPKQYLYRLTFWTRFSKAERWDIMAYQAGKEVTDNGEKKEGALHSDEKKYEPLDILDDARPENGAEDNTNFEGPNEEESWWHRSFNWFCGFSNQEYISDSQLKARETTQMAKVIQRKRDKIILNVLCVFVILIGVVLYGIYA